MTAPRKSVVVFDTNQYAGSFERELCAFVTGQVGECGVGAKTAESVRDTLQHLAWYLDHVASEADDRGVFRPAALWPTPGRFNDGYGTFHDDTPEVRAKLEGDCATAQFPAYESVAIFVAELPPEDVLAEMVARAQAFCKTRHIEYRGCRLFKPQSNPRESGGLACYGEVRQG